jgi:hypothetical protein
MAVVQHLFVTSTDTVPEWHWKTSCMLSILEAKMQDATLITMNLALGSAVVKSVVLPCDNTSCKDERRWLQGIGA